VAVLLLGRALLGGAESFVVTGALAWGIAVAAPGESGRVIAWIGVAMYAAFAIGAPMGSLFYAWDGFAAVGVATLVVPALAWPLLPRVAGGVTAPQPARSRGTAATLRAVWKPGVGLALSSLGFAAVTTFIALLFVSRGWAPNWAGFSAFAAAFVAARVVGAHLPDRRGGARVAFYSVLVEVLGLIVVALAPSPSVAMVGAGLAGGSRQTDDGSSLGLFLG
jgi:predicted MFS family arabinose efflux permease